jgi:predicted transcriptional regulator
MDPIKEAFSKIKQDILDLNSSLDLLNQQMSDIKRTLNQQTNQHVNATIHTENPTNQQTHFNKTPQYVLKQPYTRNSTGNEGVPTDRQTNQQTDKHIKNELVEAVESVQFIRDTLQTTFLNLTKQEREVFLTIYELEEHGFTVDYPMVAAQLKLTESSIRDYVLKLIRKGVPVQKSKENNKKIILSIAAELKKIASRASIEALYLSKEDNRYTE